MHKKLQRALHAALITVVCVIAGSGDAGAQNSPYAAFTARYGWSPVDRLYSATGVGLELEVLTRRSFAPVVRFEEWSFDFNCLEDPCSNGFSTIAVGGKYRFADDRAFGPYAGADIGYTTWTSDITGPGIRMRAGADIRLIRHVDVNVDAGYMRFLGSSDEVFLPRKAMVGFSGGLRLWL